jgi:hypothetical protein
VAGVRFRRGRIDPSRLPGSEVAHIEFVGYAGDCVVAGRLDVPGKERLTDILNASGDLTVHDASLVSHEDGRVIVTEKLVLPRRELFAAQASGERGPVQRRISTRTGRIELDLGPYLVRGTIHVRPGTHPLRALSHPRAMVPLTDATISYESNKELRVHTVGALIINRDLVSRIDLAVEQPVMPELPMLRTTGDPRARDVSADLAAGPPPTSGADRPPTGSGR